MQNGTIVGVHDQRFSAEMANNKGLYWGSVATQKKKLLTSITQQSGKGPFHRSSRWGGQLVLCSKTTQEFDILDVYYCCSLLLFSL